MKVTKFFLIFSLSLLFAVVAYAKDSHPVAMQGKTCDTCHYTSSTDENKADPEAYKQWLASAHGLNNVGCATCHGDESNFRKSPSAPICASCHSGEVSSMKAVKKGKVEKCESCHVAHSVIASKDKKAPHKVIKY